MAVECKTNSQLIKKVAEIYKWLDLQISDNSQFAGKCDTCGKCCDFESFDHKLFVTPPELIYLTINLHGENLKPMKAGKCPYQTNDKCTRYDFRFAGCRIFCCKGDADFQSKLSESVIGQFKSLCREFQIPYRYTDLATALNDLAVV
jgi:Fe-S-cluster containining protein